MKLGPEASEMENFLKDVLPTSILKKIMMQVRWRLPISSGNSFFDVVLRDIQFELKKMDPCQRSLINDADYLRTMTEKHQKLLEIQSQQLRHVK